ncbi:response regulator [Mucilaginibacter arboris]|uniref:Response regulator n=1 Tax=Mucilaginibacter arboris TaxID=2682090 RepID=A0A7K1T0H4_9SPHI|nr:response regulator [Mucilaginibacter arboris]MVN23059.1 response regulator [Mucilaginibacter arboris]
MELLASQKRILVLDKDSRIQSVVDEISCYGDFDLQTIYDPNAVYDKAKVFRPDLIILDYLLLDGDCAVICQDLKQDAELHTVPIIIVTAYKTKKANEDFYKCDALFIKPLDIQVLASKMAYLMAS